MKKIILLVCLVLLVGCNRVEQIDYQKGWLDKAHLETNKCLLEKYVLESMWSCIEWSNRTEINPDYLDNCCIYLNISLERKEVKTFNTTINGNTSFKMEISQLSNDTIYKGGGICFDGNENLDSMGVGNQTINMSLCLLIPKYIVSNESICVTKILKR